MEVTINPVLAAYTYVAGFMLYVIWRNRTELWKVRKQILLVASIIMFCVSAGIIGVDIAQKCGAWKSRSNIERVEQTAESSAPSWVDLSKRVYSTSDENERLVLITQFCQKATNWVIPLAPELRTKLADSVVQKIGEPEDIRRRHKAWASLQPFVDRFYATHFDP